MSFGYQFTAGRQNLRMGYLTNNKMTDDTRYSYQLNGHIGPSKTSDLSQTDILHNFANKLSAMDARIPFSFPCSLGLDSKKKFDNHKKSYSSVKQNNFMKDPLENWRNMKNVCSQVLSEPRGFSTVSNPICSYIVGGFVGSKSQMNNDKHKQSIDLGAFIWDLLNNWKWEKAEEKVTKDKMDENRSFKNNSGQISNKSDIVVQGSSHEANKLNELAGESANIGGVVTVPSEKADCSDVNESPSFTNTNNMGKFCVLSKSCIENSVKNPINSHDQITEPTKRLTDDNSSDKSTVGNRCNNNQEETESCPLLMCCTISSPKGTGSCIPSPTFVDSFVVSDHRRRVQSECSIDSTDSDSYIIFDEQSCDAVTEDEKKHFKFCFEIEDEDGSSDDEYSICNEDHAVADANERWAQGYSDVKTMDYEADAKKVRFNEDVDVHVMVTWDYAYRSARLGPWEEIARDRVRFRDKIVRFEAILAPVLQQEHRMKVFRALYS